MAAPNSRFLAANGAVPSTVRVVGRSKREEHLHLCTVANQRRRTRDPGLSERMPLGQQCERYCADLGNPGFVKCNRRTSQEKGGLYARRQKRPARATTSGGCLPRRAPSF